MKVLLLAAGLGTRLRPITDTIPKCMVPIHGKPLIDFWFELLDNPLVESIMVNLHYLSHIVKDHILKSPYASKTVLVEEEELLGTAGTLLANQHFFRGGPIMLVHADNLSQFDLVDFVKAHEQRPEHCEITMMTFRTDVPESCGILKLDQQGVVQEFHEKVKNPPGDIANGAVYILDPSVLDFIESLDKEIVDFSTEVLPHYIGKIYTFFNGQYHRDIGTVESYQKALKSL